MGVFAAHLAAFVAALALPAAPAIHVPPAFRAELYASGLQHPTAMAFGPDGRLYVTEDTGKLVVTAQGSRRPTTVATALRVPLGLVWVGQRLVVSEEGRLERFDLSGTRLVGRGVLVVRLPYGEHQQDAVVLYRGRLVFGSGSTCDACVERDRRSAAILSVRPDGTDLRVMASGLRNPYGLAVQPGTGRLYATVNGQDKLGEWQPAETVVLVKQGARYGWPTCWADWTRHRLAGSCRGVTPPVAYLEPHSSADGAAFWRGALFVAEWGQYLSHKHGRVLVRVALNGAGTHGRVTRFATGFAHPLAVLGAPDGSLLVSDWERGTIYRISRR
jgi:glucose/arabinose dehydrogenase